MKIGIAQIQSDKNSLEQTLAIHKHWILRAAEKSVDFLLFPELSLTGYEPSLAQKNALHPQDKRLAAFQTLADAHSMTIGVGCPLATQGLPKISLLFFRPNEKVAPYYKQLLHPDELPYFSPGTQQLLLPFKKEVIAPAICFESLQESHIQQAHASGATLYLSSVAKSGSGMAKARKYYTAKAKTYGIPILACNAIGSCDNFIAGGQSAVWGSKGQLLAQLPEDTAGLLVYETEFETVITSIPI